MRTTDFQLVHKPPGPSGIAGDIFFIVGLKAQEPPKFGEGCGQFPQFDGEEFAR